jgi:hypothetical protein
MDVVLPPVINISSASSPSFTDPDDAILKAAQANAEQILSNIASLPKKQQPLSIGGKAPLTKNAEK